MANLVMVEIPAQQLGYPVDSRRMCELYCGEHQLYTIERPWIPNQDAPDGIGAGVPFDSSVPFGIYDLVLRDSPKHGLQWHLVNPELGVFLEANDRDEGWQRYSCMLHMANFVDQVSGCIGPGRKAHNFGADKGWGVSSSALALKLIKEHLAAYGENASHQLQILPASEVAA